MMRTFGKVTLEHHLSITAKRSGYSLKEVQYYYNKTLKFLLNHTSLDDEAAARLALAETRAYYTD